jgi:hypothetical protein
MQTSPERLVSWFSPVGNLLNLHVYLLKGTGCCKTPICKVRVRVGLDPLCGSKWGNLSLHVVDPLVELMPVQSHCDNFNCCTKVPIQ